MSNTRPEPKEKLVSVDKLEELMRKHSIGGVNKDGDKTLNLPCGS